MRIGLNTLATEVASSSRSDGVQKGSVARGGAPDSHSAQDSSFHSRLQSLQAAVMNAPEVREDKVERIARVLRAGTYRVDAEQTAQAMLAESRGLA